jgi:hypothetical protein
MSLRRCPRSLRASSLILAGCLCAASTLARADQVVYFLNGKAITVTKVEKGDKITILEIEGGGRIGIPTMQIDRIEDLALTPAVPPPTQVTAIIPPQPTAPPVQPVPPPAAGTMPAGPGTGGHALAQNSAGRMAQPLSVGEGDEAPVRPSAPPPLQPQPQAGSQAIPPGMLGPSGRANQQMGGPGSFQRGRNGRNAGNYGKGRLPAGAYLNPGGTPQGNGNAPANGAAAPPNAPAPPNAAGAQNGAGPQSGAPGQSGQPAATQPPANQPAPPPVVTSPPPPPPPDPEPSEGDSNSDSSDDAGSSSDNDSSSGGDSGN